MNRANRSPALAALLLCAARGYGQQQSSAVTRAAEPVPLIAPVSCPLSAQPLGAALGDAQALPSPLSAPVPEPAIEIHAELTAHTRLLPSHATRIAEPLLSGSILDYGAGKGKDTEYLKQKGHSVVAYDPYFFPDKPDRTAKFDRVLLNYVINVIPSQGERDAVLAEVRDRLRDGGLAVVSVLKDSEIAARVRNEPGEYRRHSDGWIDSDNAFEHGFTREELAAQLRRNGLDIVSHHDDEPDSEIVIVRPSQKTRY